MATIDSRDVIENLINNNGIYPGDPSIYAIVEYTNAYGTITWGVTYPFESNPTRYMGHQPPYINNPRLIWMLDRGLVSPMSQ